MSITLADISTLENPETTGNKKLQTRIHGVSHTSSLVLFWYKFVLTVYDRLTLEHIDPLVELYPLLPRKIN
uniref:Mobile element protein n=1 Tax=Steinernema glaseri TaxID=37863 RepID=A0A1I7YLC7_9BILA